MATRIARQATHVISDSGSDSETEIRSSNKDHRNSHKSSLSSSSSSKRLDSKKVSSGHDRNGSAHSSHHVKSHSHSSSSTNGSSNHSNHRAKGYSQHSSSSKVNSDALQKTEKRSKSDLSSSNGSSLFSDVLHLSNSDQTPAKLSSRTVTSEKVATPKTVSNAKPKSITPPTPKTTSGAKKSSKLRDIFGSDSEDSDEDASPPNAKLDPNELVPQPTSPSPPPMSSPSPPPSPSPAPSPSSSPAPSPSPVVLPTQAPETSLSFEQAINFDNVPVNKIAKVKSSSSSKMPSSSFTKSSTNSASKTESRKSEHWSAKSSSPSVTPTSKKEPGKDVTNRDLSTGNDNKRKHISNSNNSNKSKPQCKYGSECTRKNPLHWAEYEHFDESFEQSPLPKKMKSSDGLTTDEKLIKKKYEQAQPFSFFLTQVKGIDDKYNSSFAFDISEILSPAFGNLQASCQFNYMIDISWLVQQYSPEFRKKPLLIVHGFTGAEQKGLQQDAAKFSHVSLCQARLDIPYGTHHSKMMFLLYDSGMKVVIHTANLIPGDWHQKTQAMWISPLFPKLKCGANKNEGHSPTSFKKDLHQYVTAYRNSALSEWERHILAHDMSAAKVSLIASVPGRHTMLQKNAWGHFKLRKVLIDNGPEKMEVDSWPLIGQFSSIGSLGPSPDKWLCGEFYQSLAACRSSACSTPQHKNLKLIYPTVDNVRVSLEGYPAGTCLPYSINTASKQSYLVGFMHRWRSEGRGRTRACPHIKTYMRTSPDFSMAAWFMVTSANLSKAAWGVLEKNGSQLMIRSYEIGVMFLPNLFDVRRLKLTSDIKEASNTDKTMFLLPYDLPPIRYNINDSPWIYDIPYKELPDTNGMSWCPSRL